uniref:Integrase, catalytic region, zinc finger, CCHC-type, peptidase aspartic, catalytic n=1 Tax=Tanacetum cinerariifolium TaxID=118510 RepID=A0A6L2NQJ1_TANCI|nr:integrase, catalytic region, zinc finger, CCHC-type, peptidase aspartic, catalytic [Tanacetum cinerariifolium]
MSTRSFARNLFQPLDNPELTIRRRSRIDPTLLNNSEMVAEGNSDLLVPNLRTMEELCQPSLNGRGGPNALIAIQATNFGLENDMIQQVQNSCQFHGLSGDDANKHLDKFLHVTQSVKVNGVTDDALHLYLFPHSLTHHATAWFDRLLRNSINTFEQMAKMFLGKYFPPYMIEADDQAIPTILLGLLKDIYAAVDSCETAQEMWLHVQQMMKGSDIGIQEKKAKLFNEWERFTSTDGEAIESYYHRFLKLMNDLKRNKHFPEKIASNLTFLNNLQPEWSRHVTIVHQTKDLHTAYYTQLYEFRKYNQKENYMQQPMPNPKDITDPTTAMNMALALMAKAFKLNYSTPTKNNQRISSNPHNRQIAQPGMNMGQDRQMQMVGVIQNVIQNPRIQNVGNQNGQTVVPGNANQNLNGNGNLVAARAEADLDEIEEVNANCILMANLQQASTSGTQTDKALVYDSDESAEVHNYENWYNNEIFNMFTQAEQYTELLEPILKPHQVPQNDNNVISEGSSVEQSEGTVEQHPVNVEETHVLYDSLYHNLVIEVEKINTVNRKLRETNADLTTKLARYKNLEKCFEISQEKYDKLERCYQKSVYQEQCLSKKINALHLSFELEIERHLRAVVSQDIMTVVQNNSVDETLNLQTELERTKERFEKYIIKKENEYANFGMIVTSNSIPTPLGSKVVKNAKVISPGMFRINPFKPSREEKHVPNKVRASVKTNPITVSQPPVITKKVAIQICLWCVDSGCSKHMTENLQLLINFGWKFLGTVRFGNNHVAAILGKFYYSNLEVAFRRNACFVRNLEGVDLLKGDRSTNLYTINLHEMTSTSPICLMAHASSTKSWFWHQRLSYLNFDTINDLAKNDLVSGLLKFKYHKEHLCPSCEQVVCFGDCGRLLLYTWVHFLRSKDEAPEVIKTFLKRIAILLQSPVIIKRTDNGTKFKNQVLKEYFDSVGISHQLSSVRKPQQNGVMERRNRTKPDISFLHVFGALCYPKNDHEIIGKLGAKGDIGFYIGYSADSCAYKVYNRRTKKIMETMNVSFDELLAMAFEQRSSKPELQSELDLLFEAMYDDYIGSQPSIAPRTVLAAQAHQVHQTPTISTSIAYTAPTPTNSSSQATNFLNTSQDADELTSQQHAQQQRNQAQI